MGISLFDVVVHPLAATYQVVPSIPKKRSKNMAVYEGCGSVFAESLDVIRLDQVAMTLFLQRRMAQNMGES